MPSKDTSDIATKLVGREKASANFDLTSDVIASKLHDYIVGKTGKPSSDILILYPVANTPKY
jgi:hypothetical protein